MTDQELRGVIAAIATAIDDDGAPDKARSLKLARFLLDNGCDGLNVLGTTGEATSFSLAERMGLMTRLSRTGPADGPADGRHRRRGGVRRGRADPARRRRSALPARCCCRRSITRACRTTAWSPMSARSSRRRPTSRSRSISITSRRCPACPGIVKLIRQLLEQIRQPHRRARRIPPATCPCARGGEDLEGFDVFPSTEAVLLEARSGVFRRLHLGDRELQCRSLRRGRGITATRPRIEQAVAIRKLFDGKAARRRHQGAARAYPWRSRSGTGQAAAGGLRRGRSEPP